MRQRTVFARIGLVWHIISHAAASTRTQGRDGSSPAAMGIFNYLIEIDGTPAVLRLPPAGPLPYGANDMAREYRILSSLWREYPLAPRAMLFCDEASVLGAPSQIIEYRPGMVIRDTLPPDLAGRPEVGMLLSRQLVEVLLLCMP